MHFVSPKFQLFGRKLDFFNTQPDFGTDRRPRSIGRNTLLAYGSDVSYPIRAC
jgi:hypothetical protein